jgi:predicted DNA-binding transcriptional regulator AlpA
MEKISKRFISETEFEAIYGIPKSTLQKWRLFGRGPVFRKFGLRAVRYDVNEVESWIKALPSGGGGQRATA